MITLEEAINIFKTPCQEWTYEQESKLKEFIEYYNDIISRDPMKKDILEGMTKENNLIGSAKESNENTQMSLKGERVLVEWVDAVSGYNNPSGWIDLNDFESPLGIVETYGVVVLEDKDVLCVAGSYSKENDYSPEQGNGIMTIPKACIRGLYSIKIEKKLEYKIG